MTASTRIDASLGKLRQELEGMQKQDKALYTQLLTLQESIRSLKTELKKEREETEEAFRDLEEVTNRELEDEVFVERTEQVLNENVSEKQIAQEVSRKHERQDSGISVRTPEAETFDGRATLLTRKPFTPDLVKSNTIQSNEITKQEIIPHNKHDLDAQEKKRNVEITQKRTSSAKPVLIHHSKQDSGILIDEEAVKDTKLLSKLVESSEMFEKIQNRKIDRIIQNRWQQVREQPLGNRSGSKYKHQRSRSSNDLLLKFQPQRALQHKVLTSSLRPKHSHTNSCPQTNLRHFTTHETRLKNDEKAVQPRRDELGLTNIEKPIDFTSEKIALSNENKDVKAGEDKVIKKEVCIPRISTPEDRMKTGDSTQPKHSHTRSLPTNPRKEMYTMEMKLANQARGRSMQNISEYRVVPAHQTRPRQRSASLVDLDTSGGIENRDSLPQSKARVVHVPSFNSARESSMNSNQTNLVFINNIKQESTLAKADENKADIMQAAKPLRAVLVSAGEVNVSSIPESRRILARRRSLDGRETRNYSNVTKPQRRFTLTEGRPGQNIQNGGKLSPRFLSPHSFLHPRSHLRHHTMPEYDVMKRRHSLHTWHTSSKSWDGSTRKSSEVKGVIRSASHVSLV